MITIQVVQKKPVQVNAVRFTKTRELTLIMSWLERNQYVFLLGDATDPDSLRYPDQEPDDDSRPDKGIYIDPATGLLMIRTLEGDVRVSIGDWIIQGVEGEFYPCKDSIFRKTYDIVPF